MIDLRFEIDYGTGYQQVQKPINAEALKIEVLFTHAHPSASLQATNLEWTGDEAKNINNYVLNGLKGGKGIFEGLPLRIWACTSPFLLIFDGIIVLTDEGARFECDMVNAPIRESGRIDWLNDVASSFSFAYLREIGIISPASDYKKVPYVINEIPNYSQAILVSISIFIIVRETAEVIKSINSAVADITAGFAQLPLAGLLIAAIAKMLLYFVFLIVLIATLSQLIKDLFDNIIQRKKYKLAMREEDLWRRGCQYLGLQFSSSIYAANSIYKDSTWIPKKTTILDLTNNPLNPFKRPEDEGVNFPNNPDVYGYYEGTFKQFITDMMLKYNGDIVIQNNVLLFEEKHSFNNFAPYQLPNTVEPGYTFNQPQPNGTNASELAANYVIRYSLDTDELSTLHRYRGSHFQMILEPNVVGLKKHLLLKNLEDVTFTWAMARRKEHLTKVETQLNKAIQLINNFVVVVFAIISAPIKLYNKAIQAVGGNPIPLPVAPQLPTMTQRIGWLELSNDSFSVPKNFIGTPVGSDWELHPNSENILAADALFTNFHGKNLATRGNQWLTYFDKKIKFCCTDYNQVKNSNILITADGKSGKFTRILWDLNRDEAEVDYRLNQIYTLNLKEKPITDGG